MPLFFHTHYRHVVDTCDTESITVSEAVPAGGTGIQDIDVAGVVLPYVHSGHDTTFKVPECDTPFWYNLTPKKLERIYVCMYVWPAHSAEYFYFLVPVRAGEFGLASKHILYMVWPSRPASARSFSTLRPNLVIIHGSSCFPRRRLSMMSPAIESVSSLSRRAIAYRWRTPLRVCQHKALCHQGSSSNGCCLLRKPNGPSFVRPSFPTPTILLYSNILILVQLTCAI